MPFKVAVVGRPRDQGIASAIAEYEERASRYWPLTYQEVKVTTTGSAPPDIVRKREGEKLLAAAPGDARVVACDEKGREMKSKEFAEWLVSERDRAASVVFIIGGAFGLDDAVRKRASMLLSLSQFTLPHELARLVLVEQLYRAGTIARGEPYHK